MALVEETADGDGASLIASYGWTRHGIGRNYNSSTGDGYFSVTRQEKWTIMFETKTGVCAFTKGKDVAHTCFSNWDGSRKGMEPTLTVSMVM